MKFLKDKLVNSDLGILISLGSALGYGLYFSNQAGFNSYYSLPSEYISFSVPKLALCLTIVYSLIAMFLLYSGSISIATKQLGSSIFNKRNINRVLMGFVFSIGLSCWVYKILNFSGSTSKISVIASLVVSICCIYMFWNLLKNRSMILVLISVSVFSVAIAHDIGRLQAIGKDSYLALKQGKQDFVVLNTYDNKFIISPYDSKKRIIKSEYQFIEMKSEKNNKLVLSLVHTGSLKVEK